MADHNVLVLGGGIGGLVAAHRLRRGLDSSDRVVLIDRSAHQYYAPSFLWTLTGDRQPDRIRRPLARLQSHGIQVEQAEVTGIDVEARKVISDRGAMRYDQLVIALGVGLDPGATDGFEAAAHNFYTADGAASGRDALDRITSGRVAVAVAGSPYKCPAAPWEAALLAEATLRANGVRDRTSVVVHTPEPMPMPVAPPEVGQAVLDLLADRDIEVHLEHPLDHKAGVFAHAQGEVGADRIVDELAGRRPTATFDGHGACFLEAGDGKAAYATGDFYAPQGPQLELRPPARRWHALKIGLERFWLTRWWW